MSLKWADRIKESAIAPGSGNVTLGGASPGGFATFASFMSNGDQTYYTINDGVGAWEVGLGTWNTGGTFTRNTVYASSTGGSKVNFTNPVTIWSDSPAGATPLLNASSQVCAPGGGTVSAALMTSIPVDQAINVLGSSHGGAGTVSGILKANGSGLVSAAISSTDYAPATPAGTNFLLSNSVGGFTTVVPSAGPGFNVTQQVGNCVAGRIPQYNNTGGALQDTGLTVQGNGTSVQTVLSLVNGNFPIWNSSGALVNSGYAPSSFAPPTVVSGSGPSGSGTNGQLWAQV